MTVLWPRLPTPVAEYEYDTLADNGPDRSRTHHVAQIYAPLGGRVSEADIDTLAEQLTALARQHAYPDPAAATARVAFDRAAAPALRHGMDLSWSEAGQPGTWSFLALVAMPHLTRWRFGTNNVERWIATDLTRHTWARLWWQSVIFEPDPELLPALSESDLNQLLERRTLGGDPRVTCALARAVIERTLNGSDRRPLIRDVAARLLRRLAFLDPAALDDAQLDDLCQAEARDSARQLKLDDQESSMNL